MKHEFMALLALGLFIGCERAEERKFDAERSSAGYRTAMADYQAGRLPQAASGLEQVINAEPANASARFQLACLKQDFQHDYLGAMVEFREFMRLAAKSDRAEAAEVRFKRCQELFTAECAAGAAPAAGGCSAEVLAKLQRENAELMAKLERAQREAEVRQRELDRVRAMMQSVGAAEGEETLKPTKLVLTDAELLDEAGEDTRPAIKANDFAKLLGESEELEKEAAPLSREVVVKEKKPVERPATADPAPAERPATYVVQEGDTLIGLAKRFYGNPAKWKAIRDANKPTISMDGRVRAGMEITLP